MTPRPGAAEGRNPILELCDIGEDGLHRWTPLERHLMRRITIRLPWPHRWEDAPKKRGRRSGARKDGKNG